MRKKFTQNYTTGRKRLLAILLTLGLLLAEPGLTKAADAKNQPATQDQTTELPAPSEADTYIITLENSRQGDGVLDKLNKSATREYQNFSELPEENIAVIQADENKIKELKETDGVRSIEEDIILNGSKNPTSKKNHKETDSSLIKKKQKKIAEWKDKTSSENTGAGWNIQMVGADNLKLSDKQSQSTDANADEDTKTIPPATTDGAKKIKVAVIDSGMDTTEHYDVKEHINFIKDDGDVAQCYEDRTGHGTAIAGIIAGNGSGVPGINPDVELYSLKVLDENNQSPASRIIEAIYWCIGHDI